MAIYIDNKILSPNKEGTQLEKLYYEGIEQIKKLIQENNGSLMLVRDFEKIWNIDRTSFKPAPPHAVPTAISVFVEDIGSVEVRYSKSAPVKSGERIIWNAADIMIEEQLVLKATDIDLAWFIMVASKWVEKGLLRINNPLQELEVEASKYATTAKVDSLLMLAESPLRNDAMLEKIIKRYKVVVPEKASLEAKALLIRKAVIDGKKAEDFITYAEYLAPVLKKAKANTEPAAAGTSEGGAGDGK